MPRRSSRPKWITPDTPLPEGWERHDGGACPLPADSKPAVMFRMGTRFQPGLRTAASWGDMWGDTGRPMEIVAFRRDNGGDPA